MNKFNPNKLSGSKWTAVTPSNKEKHFMVTKTLKNESEKIIGCELLAVHSNNIYHIDWQELKLSDKWLQGWK